MNNGVKEVAINAMIACVYAALTIACSSIAYGGIQFRISEILIFLAFYNKKYIPGLIIGCFLANLPSPLGFCIYFCKKGLNICGIVAEKTII